MDDDCYIEGLDEEMDAIREEYSDEPVDSVYDDNWICGEGGPDC